MTPTEAAEAFGVSRETVSQMIKAGEFESLHLIGGRVRPQYLVSEEEVGRLRETRRFPRSSKI